uniref:Uncharacterized protein n=1 Tax=Aegilops tauschii subsp. strangulata TaxID=200361 RepID=A0A453QAJ6_AEGTS
NPHPHPHLLHSLIPSDTNSERERETAAGAGSERAVRKKGQKKSESPQESADTCVDSSRLDRGRRETMACPAAALLLPLLLGFLAAPSPARATDPYAAFDWDVSYVTRSPLGVPQKVWPSLPLRLLPFPIQPLACRRRRRVLRSPSAARFVWVSARGGLRPPVRLPCLPAVKIQFSPRFTPYSGCRPRYRSLPPSRGGDASSRFLETMPPDCTALRFKDSPA